MAKVISKIPFKPIERRTASVQDIERGLALLAKERHTAERIKAGELKPSTSSYKKRSEMSKEELAKTKAYDRRYAARNALMLSKAKSAGITVSEAEIDAAIKAKA